MYMYVCVVNQSLRGQADDGRTTDVETIQVVVVDINDNRPQFSEDEYTVTIVENSPSGMGISTHCQGVSPPPAFISLVLSLPSFPLCHPSPSLSQAPVW